MCLRCGTLIEEGLQGTSQAGVTRRVLLWCVKGDGQGVAGLPKTQCWRIVPIGTLELDISTRAHLIAQAIAQCQELGPP